MNIAIIGASADHSKFGNKAVRAYKDKGYAVYPINPKETIIEGLKVYRSILDIPDKVDVVSLYVPPTIGITLVDEIAKKGVPEVYLNPGTESDELIAALEENGIKAIVACSIIAIGKSPSQYN